MGSSAKCEDPDEMPHNAAFHQVLHSLLKQINLQRKRYTIFLVFFGGNYSLWPLNTLVPNSVTTIFGFSLIGRR